MSAAIAMFLTAIPFFTKKERLYCLFINPKQLVNCSHIYSVKIQL